MEEEGRESRDGNAVLRCSHCIERKEVMVRRTDGKEGGEWLRKRSRLWTVFELRYAEDGRVDWEMTEWRR